MKKRQRYLIVGLIPFFALLCGIDGDAAVTSTGEINVKDDDQGLLHADSTVTLIVTLLIDRSLARPVEEDIRTIEILLPNGFVVEQSNFGTFSRDSRQVGAMAEIPGTSRNRLRVRLDEAITDFENTVNEITFDTIFDTRTPDTIAEEVTFRVRLRNWEDQPIGEFIKPGNVDGISNNDDFTLQVIPNVPPEPVEGFTVERDPNGENDAILTWQKSDDPDVSGYLIYRDAEEAIDVKVDSGSTRETELFIDVNVTPGNHTYAIEAYKGTKSLKSSRSEVIPFDIPKDITSPDPPERLIVGASSDGVKVTWDRSSTRDVEKYKLFFGTLGEPLTPLKDIDGNEVEISVESNGAGYLDARRLGVGVFIYAVEAIDEASNRSKRITQTLRILDKPFPNPFTPLSDNPDFNRVVFPARAIEGVEGEFIVLIFDINGVLVRELKADPDMRELEWDGKDENGDLVESGVYVYQIQMGESFDTGTVIVAK